MKKLLLSLTIALSLNSFSQAISVNTSTYTVPQLVNTVLINSPCVSATNITSKTGSNYGSSNGIGFFQNTNTNFPMLSGVILSTGNVNNAVGPNNTLLNDGTTAWPGDSDLENTLAAAGITMSSTNATILEFDFTPISSTFSFDFLFASEEYGNFQCQFSDAFAFLLTNTLTGVTTNLAVVPNTSLPISVVTIRDFLYNSSCPSANSQYFGTYNGGSAAAGSATNFNGQTVLMNASSVLTPNTPYHIKLVIADRADAGSDSSIFISSDTFNIGQDVLGFDLTVANNTAVCYGATYTLSSGLSPATYSFSWTRNGVTIPGAVGANLNITQPGIYGVTYTNVVTVCQPVTDFVTVEYFPQLVTPNPKPIYACANASGNYTYDLSYNTPIVLVGLDPLTTVRYFATAADASNNVNALPLNYASAGNQTVYVRTQQPNSACSSIKSFQLLLTPAAVAHQPQDMIKCERAFGTDLASFNFNVQKTAILGGQSAVIYVISYFASLADAQANTNPITNITSYISSDRIIYVRVQNATEPSCYATTSFALVVNPIPLVDKLPNLILCGPYTLPALINGNYFTLPNGGGTPMFAGDIISLTTTLYIFNQPGGPLGCSAGSTFLVKIIDPLQLSPADGSYCGSYTLPSLNNGNYFTGAGGTGTQLHAGDQITTSQTLYVYFVSPTPPFCVIDTDFNVTILPGVSVDNQDDVFACSSYILPALTVGNYFTQTNGGGTQIAAGTAITTTQLLYVFGDTGAPNHCISEDSFTVFIGFVTPANIAQCNGYTLPALAIGDYYTAPAGTGTQIPAGTVINTTQNVYVYIPSVDAVNCTDNVFFTLTIAQPAIDVLSDVTVCDSYTLPVLTNGDYFTGTDGTGSQLTPGDIITTNQSIYIFKRLDPTCFSQNMFTITVNPKPLIDSRSDIDICNYYILTALTIGNYYTGPGGTGTMLPAGTRITTSQLIYIYGLSNTVPACPAENSFTITVFPIHADAPANVTACDSYTLPALTIGNYFTTSGGANAGSTNMLHAGDVITTSTLLYIYAESGQRINCTDENTFQITINHTPVVAAVANVNACGSYTLPPLTIGNYYTGPGKTGTLLNANTVLIASQTLYVYAETATAPNCSNERSFNVNILNADELADVTICQSYTLPGLTIGSYYTGPNHTGTSLSAGQSITTTQVIYVYVASTFTPTCYDESSFNITIVPAPVAYLPTAAQTTVCDLDGTNDGITSFNLSSLNAAILGTQTGAEFTVTYYPTMADASAGTNAFTSTNLTTVFVRVSNTLTTNCNDIKTFSITVVKLPEPAPLDGIICYNTVTNTLINPYLINAGISPFENTFEWFNEAGTSVGTGFTYIAIAPGTYSVVATSIATGCSSAPVPAVVSPSQPAVISYSVSEDFADNQIVTIVAVGLGGDYEYMLDNGTYQDSPVFDHVSSGIHIVSVRDKNGCGTTTTSAFIVNYPHYFTPNGDGQHDTWNIIDLKDQPNATISIFDRYGKFIMNLTPSGAGWDGSFNGLNLPSTDYWFTVNYIKDGETKEFKSHFAMKR